MNEPVPALKPARCVPGIVAGTVPDPRTPWMPEHLTALHGAPGYDLLSPDQRLRYNQYCALHLAEQFTWIESFFLIAPVLKLLERGGIPDRYVPILRSFVADEESHNQTFWVLLKAARPDLYPKPGYRLFHVPGGIAWAARLAKQFPRLLSSWVLFVNFFEEQSLMVYREYEAAAGSVDGLFSRVHAMHAQDEARHCSLDRVLAEWLIEGQGRTASLMNGRHLAYTLGAYLDPRWGFDAPVRALARDFPPLAVHLPKVLEDMVRARGADYQRGLFDRAVTPMTDRNRARYPILDAAIRRFG